MGRVMEWKGTCAIASQHKRMMLPHKKTAGIIKRWSAVAMNCRTICGTARPIKAIGPVKAVMLPAKILVAITSIKVVRFIETPMLSAYLGPKRSAFIDLIEPTATASPRAQQIVKIKTDSQDKLPKLPNDQKTNCCSFWAVLK